MRPNIKSGDVDLDAILGVAPADGWLAHYTNETRPVVLWLLLRDGGLVGLVGDANPSGTIYGELRSADRLNNFAHYGRDSAR
jgi:hypothetical protein